MFQLRTNSYRSDYVFLTARRKKKCALKAMFNTDSERNYNGVNLAHGVESERKMFAEFQSIDDRKQVFSLILGCHLFIDSLGKYIPQ